MEDMNCELDVAEGFVKFAEFPVSSELEEVVLELTNRAREGEYTEWDYMHFYSFLDYQRSWAFPTAEELMALPSWKALRQAPEKGLPGRPGRGAR